jgi:Ca2+-binding RTX toxin-like protein
MFDFSGENTPLSPDLEIENPLNYVPQGGGFSIETRSSSNLRQLRERIDGTDDADLLVGTDDADTINGGAGNDTLNGRAGADVLQGGEGNDTYRLNATNSGGVLINDSAGDNDRLNLGGGNLFRGGLTEGKIGYIRQGTNLIIDLNRNAQIDAANDVTIENFFAEDGTAGSGFIEQVDNLTGEVILATSGVAIVGSRGADTLNGANNNDLLDGGNGNDDLSGGNGNGADTLIGGPGNDNLVGRDGNDSLDGGTGNDKLDGNGGRDTLIGGGGADTLQGGTGNDVYRLNANNAGGSKINDTGGNDVLELAGANLRSSYGFVRGQVGYERNENSLVIDLNRNGRYDVNNDLTIENFYVEGTRRIAEGFIEQVDNLSGRDIQLASPVFYEFSFENSDGDAGVGSISGVLSLPASVLENENPNRTFKALSVKVTEGRGFNNDEFIESLEDVDFTEFTDIANTIRGETTTGSNEFSAVDGEITFANFRSTIPRSNEEVGEFGDSLSFRVGDQGVAFDPSNPVPFILANLSSIDDDSYEGAEGCATPYGNGDCALDLTSASTVIKRVR